MHLQKLFKQKLERLKQQDIITHLGKDDGEMVQQLCPDTQT